MDRREWVGLPDDARPESPLLTRYERNPQEFSPVFHVEYSPNNDYFALRVTNVPYRGKVGHHAGGGPIKEFSNRSRRRLMRLLNCIDRLKLRCMPLFVTLTYPATWDPDPRAWRTHLNTFWKRVARKYPQAGCIWRLEFQERGAPHFHLMIFNVPFMPHQWVAAAWNEIVAPGDADHLRAGHQVRRVNSWRQAVGYAAKYMSKPGDLGGIEPGGRLWGWKSRENVPVEVVSQVVSEGYWRTLKTAIMKQYRDWELKIQFTPWLCGASIFKPPAWRRAIMYPSDKNLTA